MVKNPNWQKADQLAIYKHGQGVELGATEKQLLLVVRVGLEPGASRLQVWRPNPLDHAASCEAIKMWLHQEQLSLMLQYCLL